MAYSYFFIFIKSADVHYIRRGPGKHSEDNNDDGVSRHPVTTSAISVCFRPDNFLCVRSSSRLGYSTGMALVKVNDDLHAGKFLALTPHPLRWPLLPLRGSGSWEVENRKSQEPHFSHSLRGTAAPWGDFRFFCFPLVREPRAKHPGREALRTVRGMLDRRGSTG